MQKAASGTDFTFEIKVQTLLREGYANRRLQQSSRQLPLVPRCRVCRGEQDDGL
jgi:hypothetical protein